MLSSIVTSKGQVTLPAKIRRQVGIKSSDRVYLSASGDKIVIEKFPSLDQLFGSLANPDAKPLSLEKMDVLTKKMFKAKK